MKTALAIAGALALAGCSAPAPRLPDSAVLLFFVGTACPKTEAALPEIRRLGEAWLERGGRVWLVYAEPGLELSQAEAHAATRRLTGTIILDVPRSLAGSHGVEGMPTAVVPGVYKGGIGGRGSSAGSGRGLEAALNGLAGERPPF